MVNPNPMKFINQDAVPNVGRGSTRQNTRVVSTRQNTIGGSTRQNARRGSTTQQSREDVSIS